MRQYSVEPSPTLSRSDAAHVSFGAPRAIRAPVRWWLQVTAPAEPAPSASFSVREHFRHGRLASVLLFGLLLICLGALYQYRVVDDDHPAMVAVLLVALALAAIIGVLNRLGQVTLASLLLVALADLPLPGIPATALDGRLDVLHLNAFYLLAGSVLVAASLLAPWSVFLVATANCLLMLGIVVALPHTTALDQLLASNNGQQALAGPMAMQFIIALVAFLWSFSTLRALRRADRAEELAQMERREVERTHELEEGVEQLLAVHVQLANGNFSARVPAVRNPLLWQIGSSLNNLVARFARVAQADFALRRTQEEAHRLTEAVLAQRAGRAPLWPAPVGTPLDEVVAALGGYSAPAPPSSTNLGGSLPAMHWQHPGELPSQPSTSGPTGPQGPRWASTDASSWLFPRSLADGDQ